MMPNSLNTICGVLQLELGTSYEDLIYFNIKAESLRPNPFPSPLN